MRILYHHRTQGRGVEGVHIREIIKGLERLGHVVEVLSPPGVTVGGAASQSGTKSGLVRTLSRSLPEIAFEAMEMAYNFNAARRMASMLSAGTYDLIFERYAIFNWSGVSNARRFDVPIIMEINYTSYTPLARRRSALLKPLAHALDRRVLRRADGFTVVSGWLRRHLIELGVDEDRIILLTNAADPDVFTPEVPGGPVRERHGLGGSFVIGYVGGFYRWHGLDFLLDVFKRLLDDCPEASLLLVGDGPEREGLRRHAERLGVANRVCFAGNVLHDDLPPYIAAFDIAVLPDSNEYCSPMKVFEYMSMARPVVAPDLENLRESFTSGVEGLLFRPGSDASLLEALETLYRDRELRRTMGERARRHVLTEHTWLGNSRKIVDLYERITAGR
ncbi:MAG TPA: glycosyltransferase family 1 protein [Deltaproteobacteria bacterium]|nr:glycosyltransferase family 1 protein [Deltaproteobacteria bacterium]